MKDISLIAFDADDTLWECQTYFEAVEKEYCELLKSYASADEISKALFAVETANMPLLGYGSKAFLLSLLENAIEVSGGRLKADEVEKIIKLGKELLQLPGKPMDGVEETLKVLRERGVYHLVVFTKGEFPSTSCGARTESFKNSTSISTLYGLLKLPIIFLHLGWFIATFPPTLASTCARSEVGTCMNSIPLI